VFRCPFNSLRLLALGLCLSAGVSLAGCFRPSDSGPAPADAGDSASGGSGGTLNAGGTGGSFPTTGGSGGGPGAVVQCGETVCGATGMSTGVEPCCSPNQQCSVRTVGSECLEPNAPDPRCGILVVGGMQLPGCCLDTGICGVNVGMLGLGCVPPEMLQAFGFMVEIRPCADVEPLPDAGAPGDDAGL
jgi:hypothetical protein